MAFDILYQDQDLLLISKPAGVVVNDAATTDGTTVQTWMRQQYLPAQSRTTDWSELLPDDHSDAYGTPEEIFAQRDGIVHRLDKDTSGVLILAKHPGSLLHLMGQFKRRRVTKTYLALVHGMLPAQQDVLDYAIARSSRDRKKFAVSQDGRPAVTTYRVIDTYSGLSPESLNQASAAAQRSMERLYEGFSLVECWPKTGRTHQIRVHFMHIQHPLVGDTQYLGKKRRKLDPLWCSRHFLHAYELTLAHPRTHDEMSWEAPLSNDLQKVLSGLTSQ